MAELEESANSAPLAIETHADEAGGAVIAISGDLDISSVGELRGAVDHVAAARPDAVTFDMSDLRFMDSAGIAVLLGAAERVPTVRLRNPNTAIRRVIELTGLTEVLKVEP